MARRLHTGEVTELEGWALAELIWQKFGISALAGYFNAGFFDPDPVYGVNSPHRAIERPHESARQELGRFIAARQDEMNDDSAKFYKAVKAIPVIGPIVTWAGEAISNVLGSDQVEKNDALQREEELARKHADNLGVFVETDARFQAQQAGANGNPAPVGLGDPAPAALLRSTAPPPSSSSSRAGLVLVALVIAGAVYAKWSK